MAITLDHASFVESRRNWSEQRRGRQKDEKIGWAERGKPGGEGGRKQQARNKDAGRLSLSRRVPQAACLLSPRGRRLIFEKSRKIIRALRSPKVLISLSSSLLLFLLFPPLPCPALPCPPFPLISSALAYRTPTPPKNKRPLACFERRQVFVREVASILMYTGRVQMLRRGVGGEELYERVSIYTCIHDVPRNYRSLQPRSSRSRSLSICA